jgi:hypothetical protein
LLVVRLPDTDFKRITEEAIKLYSRIWIPFQSLIAPQGMLRTLSSL